MPKGEAKLRQPSIFDKPGGWDRPPALDDLAKRVAATQQRRQKALDQARRAFDRRTIGGDERLRQRMRIVAAAFADLRRAEEAEIQIEIAAVRSALASRDALNGLIRRDTLNGGASSPELAVSRQYLARSLKLYGR
jgi:hypothetical protein